MTKKQKTYQEKRLRELGVRKPYVDGGEVITHPNGYTLGIALSVESYPLTAYIRPAFDPDLGTVHDVVVRDCSLPRIKQDGDVARNRLGPGVDLMCAVAEILRHLGPEAYARAKRQDDAAWAAVKSRMAIMQRVAEAIGDTLAVA